MIKSIILSGFRVDVNRSREIYYSFEISLIGLVIQSIEPNHFSKELLKYIYL